MATAKKKIRKVKASKTSPSIQVGARLSRELVARIDAYAARLQDELGLTVTRSAAIGALVTSALDAMEGKGEAQRRNR